MGLTKLFLETVQGAPMTFKSVDYIYCCCRFPVCICCVYFYILHNFFKEDFQNTTNFFVNQARYSLHASSSCKTTDGCVCDTLDGIFKNPSSSPYSSSSSPYWSSATSPSLPSFCRNRFSQLSIPILSCRVHGCFLVCF